ncbi:hypothetical protein KY290_023306 [Solanum tuberosum]|uniref:Uncharacterized protein n=1 Tax=Solanum tuberosum TaxID=4113 RepID=A0ABQ7V6U4_SOLTU|nr:hypothetical protein KY290_023306 [Solanum tuberosum]
MGRGKVELKKIEKTSNRLVTFSKRRQGLIKKANELAILCDVDVGVIVYSHNGKLYEYAKPSMGNILARYNPISETNSEPAIVETIATEVEPQTELDNLKEEIAVLHKMQSGLLAKNLDGLSFTELQNLEHMLKEGALSVKDHMERKLMGQFELYMPEEEEAMIEAKILPEQVIELQCELAMKENSFDETDTFLHLRLPVDSNLKLGTPKAENDADNPMIID